jgi:mono/diheme cytochrome c family protein
VRLNDGQTTEDNNVANSSFFFADEQKPGRLEMDLTASKNISRIHLYSEHPEKRVGQDVSIYVSNDQFAKSTLPEEQLEKNGWRKITNFKTKRVDSPGKYGVAVVAPNNQSLGGMHKLLFICSNPPGSIKHTFLTEIDIYENQAPALKPLASTLNAKRPSFIAHHNGNATFRDSGNGTLVLDFPASDKATQATLSYTSASVDATPAAIELIKKLTPSPRELTSLTKGGPSIFPQTVTTKGTVSNEEKAWVADQIELPMSNPWNVGVRPGGFDFFSDGDSAALSTWEGDVWVVTGLKGDFKEFKWKRFASGLFETLGLKIVDDIIYVHGRDQITRLHDQNKDGEADWYECFNNDVLITKNFHEFSFSLQTDKAGNFYFTKGSPVRPGGRGFDEILPHNGTIMKVSKDGKKFEVIATGLRAPGGMALGPNGEITTGENEGSWQPACKLNYFTGKDKFLGTEPAAHHLAGQKMHQPMIYFPHSVDNSGGEQVWIPSQYDQSKWGLKPDELIHLSYGMSSLYRVLPETINDQIQGGVVRIPVNIKSSAMRARFHPDHSLYTLGFRGWQTNAATNQAFERIRFTGKEINIPDQMRATDKGVYIRFEHPLDPESVKDKFNFSIERWKYIYCVQYGSGKFSIDNPDLAAEKLALEKESKNHDKRDKVEVLSSQLLSDGKTVFLHIPSMKPAEQFHIKYKLKFSDGQTAESEIMSTIHNLNKHTDMALIEGSKIAEKSPENLKPGLVQTITREGSQDIRISRLAAQYVAKEDQVSDMLSPESNGKKFTSVWSGYLVLNERSTQQFALEGNGSAVLKIKGKEILNLTGKLDGKLSESIQLDPGAHEFELSYTSADDGTAHVRTLWQTAEMPLQAVAPKYFQYQSNDSILQALHTRTGRDLMQQQNCTACHADQNLPPTNSKSSTDLSTIGSKLSEEWLAEWLASPHTMKPGTTMPAFVDGSTAEGKKDAADMAAYLASLKSDENIALTPQPEMIQQGGHLFHQLGCVACHMSTRNSHSRV